MEDAYTRPSIVAGSSRAVTPLSPWARRRRRHVSTTRKRRCLPPPGRRPRWIPGSLGRPRSPRGLLVVDLAAGHDPGAARAERPGLVSERIEHLGEGAVHDLVCAVILAPAIPVER
jgi:hypothetical protein